MKAIQALDDYLGHCRDCPICGPASDDCVCREDHKRNHGSLCPQGRQLWAAFEQAETAGRADELAALAPALADHFADIVREWLTPAELDEVRRRNTHEYAGSGVCASHDFCDANQAMIDALERIQIEYVGSQNFLVSDLIDQAWAIARTSGFAGCSEERGSRDA